jgi:5'-phosphate synthase pdxT subunit
MKIGVLALQGAFIEHISITQQLGGEASPVRLSNELNGLDGLIIPGGESTAILKLMQSFSLIQPMRELAKVGLPILGTCAGMICLAKKVSDHDMETLAVMDLEVRRNAFGRQIDSFETELPIPVLGDKPFPAVFIRAPLIERAGPEVEVMARLPSGAAVATRQGKLLATSFHPELTSDFRLHSYFLKTVASANSLR